MTKYLDNHPFSFGGGKTYVGKYDEIFKRPATPLICTKCGADYGKLTAIATKYGFVYQHKSYCPRDPNHG